MYKHTLSGQGIGQRFKCMLLIAKMKDWERYEIEFEFLRVLGTFGV